MQCRRMTKRLLSVFLVGTTVFNQAAPVYGLPESKAQQISETAHTFDTGKLTAALDVSQGGALHLKRADGLTDWNHSTGSMRMGATCILNADGTEAPSNVGSQKESILSLNENGMGSLELSGDVKGKKSYFVFEDEVYFLGQGMGKADSINGDVTAVTMVENMPVTNTNRLTQLKPSISYKWANGLAIESPTLADSGPSWRKRNWLYMSEPYVNTSSPDPGGYGYIFKDSIYDSRLTYQTYKTAQTTGEQNNFRAWMPHDQNNDTYSFSLSAGQTYNEMNVGGSNSTVNSKVSELSNTEQIQSVFYDIQGGGILGVRFWSESGGGAKISTPIGDITAYGPVSLMAQKVDEQTVTAVFSMSKANTGKAVVNLGFASTSYETSNSGVTVDTGEQTKVILDNDILKGASVSITFTKENTEIRHETASYGLTMDLNPKSMVGSLRLDRNETPGYYTDHYWDTINKNRIPGTVVLNTEDKYVDGTGSLRTATSKADWIGGQTVLDEQAVKGVELKGGDVSGYQSYFMFPDKIICLGSGLKNNSSAHPGEGLVAVLENYKLKDDLLDVINMSYANKTAKAWITTGIKVPLQKEAIWNRDNQGFDNDNSWIYLKNPDLGYWFPKTDMKKAEFRFTDGSSVGGEKKTWYELGLNLGTGENLTYEYAVLPSIGGAAQVKAYFTKQEHITLSNTSEIQAVYDTISKTAGINFWSAQGGTVNNSNISPVTVNGKASLLMQETEGKLSLSVSDPSKSQSGPLEIVIDRQGYGVINSSPGVSVDITAPGKIKLSVDLSQKDGSAFTAEINTLPASVDDNTERVTVKRGDTVRLPIPSDFTGTITWSSVFLKSDGTTVNNAGYSKYKRELKEGESEGTRTAGPVDASHIAEVEKLSNNDGLVKGKQKGSAVIQAMDETGKTKAWTVDVTYFSEDELPEANLEDYEKVREAWTRSLIGSELLDAEGGAEALKAIDKAALSAWNSYAYKGQEACEGVPWPQDLDSQGGSGNPDIPYEDDAIEFRQAYQKVLSMAKAYKSQGSACYQDQSLLTDMTHILDWLSANCYTPKTQTDNWWTWEIGVPKDLVPALILLYDDLTKEQREKYTKGMVFFQPDPFHEGAVGNATTHAQGYRESEGANLLDCSVTALGLGAILDDNELAYLGSYASSKEFVINAVKDTTKLSQSGFASGFYKDGSYMDHSHVPYLGAYGIEFFRGGVNLADLLHNTAWEYSDEVMGNLETYVLEGFGSCMYQGLMMDSLMGRSLSRKGRSGRDAGRDAMGLILKFSNSAGPEAKEKIETMLKNWLTYDPEYMETLTGAADMEIRRTASRIYEDSAIAPEVEPMHKNMAFMDRAFHRTNSYLFGLSMYSERIQNTEVMNNENLYGWHQSDGMTYLYDEDLTHYSDNFWNTVNPYRLPGTTVVPVPIGNGTPDGSGYYQDGDWRSYEKWVGGSTIGNYGINGMALSGKNTSEKVAYAPELTAKKSWFMFEDEIVCLGAGINNQSEAYPTETIVENRRLTDSGDNEIIVNGESRELELKETHVSEIVTGEADISGILVKDIAWAYLEGSRGSQGTGYYFPEEGQTLHMRKTANRGDWANIGTTQGEAVKNYLEMWFDHGKNPHDESYSYVLLPGKSQSETESYAFHPGITVLENSQEVQAVTSSQQRITGANFWKNKVTSVGPITCNKMASVMMQEDEETGLLTIAVSDPTMKNTGTIEVSIELPVSGVVSCDENVEADIDEDGILQLTVSTKQKGGDSSYAQVQLMAGINPSAVFAARGETISFEAIDYETGSDSFIWTVTGDKADVDFKTTITDGVLIVGEKEPNDRILVTAKSIDNPSISVSAQVLLKGDVPVKIPEDITEIKNTVEKLEHLLDPDSDGDFGSHEVQQKVFAAVKAVKAADNDDLAKFAFGQVMTLEQLYHLAAEGKGRSYGTSIEVEEDLDGQIDNVRMEGALLSIPVTTATASNAVLEMKKATSSEASRRTATASAASRKKATPSAAVPRNGRLEGQKLIFIKEGAIHLDIQLFLEVMDEEDIVRKSIQPSAPIRVYMDNPFVLEEGERIYILHYHNSSQPEIQEAQFTKDGDQMFFYLTSLSPFVITKGVNEGGAEKPDSDPTPTPDPDQKPDEEKPSEKPVRDDSEDDEDYDAAPVYPDAEGTWKQDEHGWWFQYLDGKYPRSQWEKIGGKWYYFDPQGYMATGWLLLSGKWYYLQPDGAMLSSGWVLWKDRWYYCDSDGAMLTNFMLYYDKKWYRLGADGAWLEE